MKDESIMPEICDLYTSSARYNVARMLLIKHKDAVEEAEKNIEDHPFFKALAELNLALTGGIPEKQMQNGDYLTW